MSLGTCWLITLFGLLESGTFINGSLRVYINGTRINSASSTKVLIGSQPSVDANWKDIYIESQDPTTGTFSLNTTIESSTNIFIDFNTTT